MTKRRLRLVTEAFTASPALDTAVSRALLQRASEGSEPETLRLHRPAPIVAFGPQDLRSPGYPHAVEAAVTGGYAPVQRLAGGRAAVFHEDTIAFAWTIPDPDPRERIHERFRELAGLMETAFRKLGIDARVGEVAGEYCPGEYSVNVSGRKKLMGVGQRLVRNAAHIGGVVVVDGAERVRDILVPVYDALGLEWDPSTVGSLAGEVPGLSFASARQSIIDAFAERYELYDGMLNGDVLALAESLEPEHAVDAKALRAGA